MSRILELQKIIACDIVQGTELLKYVREQDKLLKKLSVKARREEIAKILAYKPIQYTRKQIEVIVKRLYAKPETHSKIKELLIAGKTNQDIALICGVSTETVRKWRGKFGFSKPAQKRFTDDQLLEQLDQKKTDTEIAELFGVTRYAITKRRLKLKKATY